MGKKKQKLIYTQWGLANYYSDHIELNKAFRKDKKLRDYVVQHELKHTDKFDIQHDLTDIKPQTFRLMWFVLIHPRTWIDFLPIQIKKGEIIYDTNLTILYGLCIVLSIILFKLL